MKRQELIQRLSNFVQTGDVRWRGQVVFVRFFMQWLSGLDLKVHEQYDFWYIDDHVPQLVVDALEDLRTGTDAATVEYRTAYQNATEQEVPNVAEIGESDLLNSSSTVQTVGFTLSAVMGEDWDKGAFDSYANAQKQVVQLTFDKFLRHVFRRGLFDLIENSKCKGMSGKFGETELRTYALAGRLMFTFARRLRGKTVYRTPGGGEDLTLPYREISVSFIAEEGDPLALSSGIQSVHANLHEAMSMIEDVIRGWPADVKKRAKAYKDSKSVSMI